MCNTTVRPKISDDFDLFETENTVRSSVDDLEFCENRKSMDMFSIQDKTIDASNPRVGMRHFIIVPHMGGPLLHTNKDVIINGNRNGSEGKSGSRYVNERSNLIRSGSDIINLFK